MFSTSFEYFAEEMRILCQQEIPTFQPLLAYAFKTTTRCLDSNSLSDGDLEFKQLALLATNRRTFPFGVGIVPCYRPLPKLQLTSVLLSRTHSRGNLLNVIVMWKFSA